MTEAEKLAKFFHDAYEELAPSHGYETREASRKPWADVPKQNKGLMIAVAQRVLDSWNGEGVGSFSRALDVLKAGGSVSRSGWNGKGMYVVLQKGYPDGIAINANTAEATGLPEGTVCSFLPYLMLCTADGTFVPWVAYQSDLLAEDWAEGPNEAQTPADDLEQLQRDQRKLYALQALGVDNWDGYDDAMELYREGDDD